MSKGAFVSDILVPFGQTNPIVPCTRATILLAFRLGGIFSWVIRRTLVRFDVCGFEHVVELTQKETMSSAI